MYVAGATLVQKILHYINRILTGETNGNIVGIPENVAICGPSVITH
jgi:hypothetical protein